MWGCVVTVEELLLVVAMAALLPLMKTSYERLMKMMMTFRDFIYREYNVLFMSGCVETSMKIKDMVR